jgi:hypothetical protein
MIALSCFSARLGFPLVEVVRGARMGSVETNKGRPKYRQAEPQFRLPHPQLRLKQHQRRLATVNTNGEIKFCVRLWRYSPGEGIGNQPMRSIQGRPRLLCGCRDHGERPVGSG